MDYLNLNARKNSGLELKTIEEESKELFEKADLNIKNEDLNNFYKDELENAWEKVKDNVRAKIVDLIMKKKVTTPLNAERDR